MARLSENVPYMNVKTREIRQVHPIPMLVNIKWTGNDRSFSGWGLHELCYIDAWTWVRSKERQRSSCKLPVSDLMWLG